jgi:hypothetical protein
LLIGISATIRNGVRADSKLVVHCRLEMHFQVALEGYLAEKNKWPISAD